MESSLLSISIRYYLFFDLSISIYLSISILYIYIIYSYSRNKETRKKNSYLFYCKLLQNRRQTPSLETDIQKEEANNLHIDFFSHFF